MVFINGANGLISGTSRKSQTFPWTISVINLESPGDQSNNDGDTVSLPLTTGYHGGGQLNYSATGLPTGLSINSTTGQITGKISGTADTNSPYSVTVSVTDGTNTSTQSFYWAVNPVVAIDAIDDQSNAAGDAVSLQASANDSLNNTLSYSASGLPTGLSIGSTTGLITGTIAAGDDTHSPYAVTVTVADSAGNSAAQSFNWNVAHVSLVNPGPQWNVDGKAVSLQLQGHDADGDTVSYSASGLPSGLSVNTSTGLISGTIASNADTNSPYNVTVTASDGHGNSTPQTFLWTVSQVSLTLPSDQTNTEGDNVSLQLQGTASSGSLNYNTSGLPTGLSLNTTTGLITGAIAPGAAANGPYIVDASAANGVDSVSQTFAWTVNPVVNLTTPADQNNNVGDSVSVQISATDSLHKTLTYSATGLPSGLSINSSTGLISGKISGGDPNGGPYVPTVTASDGTYNSSTTFNWNVTDTSALTMTIPGTQTDVASDSISVQVTASDPDGDVVSYWACNLPDGLSIDPSTGLISGIIAEDAPDPTPYQVMVTATDGNGQSASKTITWLVNPPPIAAQGVPISAEEGVDPGSFAVATFTTPDMNSLAGDFTAFIDYGDGTTDTGAISGQNGSFTVTADHIYAETGSYPISVQMADSLTDGSALATSTATVTDAALTMTGGYEYGDSFTDPQSGYIVATFTDANSAAPLSDYTVNINWGDGNHTIGSGGNFFQGIGDGYYKIVTQHDYANLYPQPGPWTYTVTVTLTDVDGASAQVTDTVVVGDIVSAVPATISTWVFVDQNTLAPASDFVAEGKTDVALINWGDGSTSLGTVSGSSGYFNIVAQSPHTYLQDSMDQPNGLYTITVTVTDDDGNTLAGKQYVSVVRPAESIYVANVDIASNLTVSNDQVAAFTVPDANDGTTEFSATINWGDGNSSSGTIQEVTPGLFQVLGSHTYAAYDWYTMTVTISQAWGGMAASSEGVALAGGKPVIRILDAWQKSATSLKVAKWQNAFYNDVATDPLDPPEPRLENDINYRDPDRFYVNVIDPAANKKMITVTVQTKGSPQGYNNPPVQIDLNESSVEKGLYRSEPLLLMSDTTDDQYPLNGVENNGKNDFTFIVALGGTFVATYDKTTADAKVPIIKVLNVNVAVLNDPTKAKNPSVINAKQLAKDIQVANERLAQVGIVIVVKVQKIGVNVPGVDLTNGYNIAAQADRAAQLLSNEEKALLGDANLLPRKEDVVNIYYVNTIKSPRSRYDGWSYMTARQAPANKKYAPSVVIAGELTKWFVLPHEIAHILLDDEIGAAAHTDVETNLVYTHPEINAKNQGVIGTKRLTQEQQNQMYKNSSSLLQNPP